MRCRQPQDQIPVKRLGKPRIGNRWRNATRGQSLSRDQHLRQPCAKAQDSHPRAFADDPAFANCQRHTLRWHLHPGAVTARKPKRNRPLVMCNGGCNHMHQFRLIRRGHHHKAGQIRQKRHIKRPRMGGTIRPHKARAINGKPHRQALNSHVMHNLIISALQEGRINRAKRLHPTRRQPRRKRHCMLFGNPDIETAFRKPVRKQVQPGAIRHCGGDGDNAVVMLRFPDQALREHLCITRRVGRRLCLRPRQHIKLARRMALVTGSFGGRIAFALFGDHMDQNGPGRAGMGGAQNRQHLIQIMAINRPDVGKAQFLKQRASDCHAFKQLLRPPRAFLKWLRQQADSTLGRSL